MAFDLVQYFAEQIKSQKPQLLNQYNPEQRKAYLLEINALTLGKLVSLWRTDATLYQEIHTQDPLYIQEIARHLTTSPHNQSTLPKSEYEQACVAILSLQLAELKQLDETGHFGQNGMKELLLGQIEHLSGQAKDWVWSTNELKELIGSQPNKEEEISLNETMKEFNLMVNSQHLDVQTDTDSSIEVSNTLEPKWAKTVEPLIALIILSILYCALNHIMK